MICRNGEQETSKEKEESLRAWWTEKKFPHERIPHAIEPQTPEYCWTDADIKRLFNTEGQGAHKSSMFMKNSQAYTRQRKKRWRQKTHQKGPNQKTKVIFDVLRKMFRKQQSLICLVIHESGNRSSKSRSNLKKVWVISKYTPSKSTQSEEDSQKYLPTC